MKTGLRLLTLVLAVIITLSGCLENRRKPARISEKESQPPKQKVVSVSSQNNAPKPADTVNVVDDNSGNIREIIITSAMREQLIRLIERSIDLSNSDVMDSIQGMNDYNQAEEKLLAEMDKIARECGFENFREANKMIDKMQDDPDIRSLMDQLTDIESRDM